MSKAEELKLAFTKKWKYLIVLNDKMHYQFDDELNELLSEYTEQESRKAAWLAWWEATIGSSLKNEKKLFNSWWKSNQEGSNE